MLPSHLTTGKPFPYDKISNEILHTIIKSSAENMNTNYYNNTKETKLIKVLLKRNVQLPDIIVKSRLESVSDSYVDTFSEQGNFSETPAGQLLMLYAQYSCTVNKLLVDYLLKRVLIQSEIWSKAGVSAANYSAEPNYLYLALRMSTEPFPQEFIDLCRKDKEIAETFILGFVPRIFGETTYQGHSVVFNPLSDPRVSNLYAMLPDKPKINWYDYDETISEKDLE